MRTTIIPAQITTVEDKIAGDLTFTQIFLLVIPLVVGILLYILMPKMMAFEWYKIAITCLMGAICLLGAIRVKDTLIFDWVLRITRFNLRPAYYVFNKNDQFLRDVDLPRFEKKKLKIFKGITLKKQKNTRIASVDLSELLKTEQLMRNQNLSFKANKRGGFDVALD